MTLRKPFLYAFFTALGLFAATGVLAWTGPCGASPSACNVSAPLNISGTGQTKVGGLRLNSGGAANGLEVISGTTLLDGNVGIGTATPAAALDVSSNVNAGGVVNTAQLIVEGNSNNVGLTLTNYQAGGRGWSLVSSGASAGVPSSFRILDSTGSIDRLVINSSGNVGIGTTLPGQKLDVAGAVQATAFYYSSDERLKKNIDAIANNTSLQKILALQPVTFNWKDPTQPTGTQLGFIAQQVEKVVPELVTTNASTSMKAVDYARVTPLLVGAAQAQQAQIDAQQKEIEELKAEVEALKAGK